MTTVKLYFDTKIYPSRNAVIDDLESFLSSKTVLLTQLAKYIKHDLGITVKLDTEELGGQVWTGDVLNPFKTGRLDYVAIKNEKDTRFLYYFVMNQSWTAAKTVALELALDTMNSFQGSYAFTDRTLVTREHQDRYWNQEVLLGSRYYYARRFYEDGDGLTPQLYKLKEAQVTDDDANFDWYLLYKAANNTSSVQPVSAYLIPEQSVGIQLSSYRLDISKLVNTSCYWFGSSVEGSYAAGTKVRTDTGKSYDMRSVFAFRQLSSGKWALFATPGGGTSETIIVGVSYLEFDSSAAIAITKNSDYTKIITASAANIGSAIKANQTGTTYPSQVSSSGIDGIDTVDRTDTTIISILKLPYSPVSIDVSKITSELPPEIDEVEKVTWQSQSTGNYFKLKTNYLQNFENELKISNIFKDYYIGREALKAEKSRYDYYESALYRSEYTQVKFVYDSFSYALQPELFATNYLTGKSDQNLSINFVTTGTMNSRFLFDFNDKGKGIKYGLAVEDYPYVMNIARNNNITVFNSEYLNYMRYGYNADVKARNASLISAGLGIGASLVSTGLQAFNYGTILGGVGKAVTGAKEGLELEAWAQKAFGDASTVGLTAENISKYKQTIDEARERGRTASVLALGQAYTGVTGIINGIQQIQQTETAFKQKQDQIKQASVSVSGADDIDLLTYYSGNRLKTTTYQVSDRMWKALGDLYYYQGYVNNEKKIPTHNSRKYFDFLQCQADIDNTNNLDQRFIDDIKAKLEIGVTYYHKDAEGNYDFQQTSSNNEIWLN